MDPNANLKEQETILSRYLGPGMLPGDRGSRLRAISPEDRSRLRELRGALLGWLRGGGFSPDWSACPKAHTYYRH